MVQLQDIPPGTTQPPPEGDLRQPKTITIDLSNWPQVKANIPVTLPVQTAIKALETTLAQLREVYIQAEVQRRLHHPVGDRATEHDGT